jgi:hypothetical protein
MWYNGGPKIEVFVIDSVPDLDPIPVLVFRSELDMNPRTLMISQFINIGELT